MIKNDGEFMKAPGRQEAVCFPDSLPKMSVSSECALSMQSDTMTVLESHDKYWVQYLTALQKKLTLKLLWIILLAWCHQLSSLLDWPQLAGSCSLIISQGLLV